MFRRIGDWFRNFMLGRNGSDQLNMALLGFGIALTLLGSLLGRYIPWVGNLSLLSYIPLFWCIFRMYSRNLSARQKENAVWLGFWARLKDKEHRYFRCPQCRQRVRVPRRRGKINIRCPKCGRQFIKKT